jgi:hypothetical protein
MEVNIRNEASPAFGRRKPQNLLKNQRNFPLRDLSFYLLKIKEADVLEVLEGIAGLHLFLQAHPEPSVIHELGSTGSIEVIIELADKDDWPTIQD